MNENENLSLELQSVYDELVEATDEKYAESIYNVLHSSVHPLFLDKSMNEGYEYGHNY